MVIQSNTNGRRAGNSSGRPQAEQLYRETCLYRTRHNIYYVVLGSVIFIILACGACTSTTFTDLSPQQLHDKIAAGEVIQPGGHAIIVTADGNQHDVIVSVITPDSVIGKETKRPEGTEDRFDEEQDVAVEDFNVPIADIVSVEKYEITHPVGQAAVATGSILALVILLALPAAVVAALAL